MEIDIEKELKKQKNIINQDTIVPSQCFWLTAIFWELMKMLHLSCLCLSAVAWVVCMKYADVSAV